MGPCFSDIFVLKKLVDSTQYYKTNLLEKTILVCLSEAQVGWIN